MIEPVLEEVKQYVYEKQDTEACGLLAVRKGRVKFFPCDNKAENPKNDFVIDPMDYKTVADEVMKIFKDTSVKNELPENDKFILK